MKFRIPAIPDDAPPQVTANHVAAWFKVGKSTVWNWVRRGWLPKPIELGRRTHLFNTAAVRAALAHALASDTAAPRVA